MSRNDRSNMAIFLALLLMLAIGLDGLLLPLPFFFRQSWNGLEFNFPTIDDAIAFFEMNRSTQHETTS